MLMEAQKEADALAHMENDPALKPLAEQGVSVEVITIARSLPAASPTHAATCRRQSDPIVKQWRCRTSCPMTSRRAGTTRAPVARRRAGEGKAAG
jgi:hypothetical protein